MNPVSPIRGFPESVGKCDAFTHAVIGKAMETHSALGPGLNDEFYNQELSARLSAAGIEHESKPRRDLLYRETTYQGLLRAALRAERIPFSSRATSPIARWGVAQLRCIVVDNACAVSVTALGDEVSAADGATLQTCLPWLDLPWGLAVHLGRRTVDVRFAVRPKMVPSDSERPQMERMECRYE